MAMSMSLSMDIANVAGVHINEKTTHRNGQNSLFHSSHQMEKFPYTQKNCE
jgi:hypothetical protein